MKLCSKCAIRKEESEFYVKDSSKGRLHAHCKQCYREHRKTFYKQHYTLYANQYRLRAKQRRERLRKDFHDKMLEYLSDKQCVICAENDIRVLEFDHINPQDKLFNISQAVRLDKKWFDVIEEIKKCRILCANCHKKHTASQANWYKNI